MPDIFYKTLNIKNYKENNSTKYAINNSWSMLLPKDSLEHFDFKEFTKLQDFNGKCSYEQVTINHMTDFSFTEFELNDDDTYLKFDKLTIAAHGLGVKTDKLLNYIRTMTFKGDVFNLLFDVEKKKLYLFFERNEKYFRLKSKINNIHISPPIWHDYSVKDKKEITLLLFSLGCVETDSTNENIDNLEKVFVDKQKSGILNKYFSEYNKTITKILESGKKPKYRWYQQKWREVLIKLDEVEFGSKGYAFCAISGLKGKYEKLGKFFIASHIKPFSVCINESDYESAFDPHNGLILSANVDALFDQYLITIDVDHDGKILKKDVVKTISRIDSIIYKRKLNSKYMTKERIKYLKFHKHIYDIS